MLYRTRTASFVPEIKGDKMLLCNCNGLIDYLKFLSVGRLHPVQVLDRQIASSATWCATIG